MTPRRERDEGDFKTHWRDLATRKRGHSEHVRNMPVIEEEAVQLTRGPSAWISAQAMSDQALLSHSEVRAGFCATTVPHPDWIAVIAPSAVAETLRINGWRAGSASVFLSASTDGLSISGGPRSGFGIGLLRSRLIAACSALSGLDPDDLTLRDLEVTLGQDAADRLHRVFWAALDDSSARPRGGEPAALAPFWERRLYSQVARVVTPMLGKRLPPKPAAGNALRIVHAAEAACRDLAHPPTIDELCAAAGVGERWLRKCFIDVRGAPPAHYLLKRRLSAARDRLADPDAEVRTIKDVAISLGFLEPGRFAQYYQKIFCERPADTRARALLAHRARLEI